MLGLGSFMPKNSHLGLKLLLAENVLDQSAVLQVIVRCIVFSIRSAIFMSDAMRFSITLLNSVEFLLELEFVADGKNQVMQILGRDAFWLL